MQEASGPSAPATSSVQQLACQNLSTDPLQPMFNAVMVMGLVAGLEHDLGLPILMWFLLMRPGIREFFRPEQR